MPDFVRKMCKIYFKIPEKCVIRLTVPQKVCVTENFVLQQLPGRVIKSSSN